MFNWLRKFYAEEPDTYKYRIRVHVNEDKHYVIEREVLGKFEGGCYWDWLKSYPNLKAAKAALLKYAEHGAILAEKEFPNLNKK